MELWTNGVLCLEVADFLLFIKTAGLSYLGMDYGIWVLSEVPAFYEYAKDGLEVCTQG